MRVVIQYQEPTVVGFATIVGTAKKKVSEQAELIMRLQQAELIKRQLPFRFTYYHKYTRKITLKNV
jgi:hypothetical protein